MRDARRSDGPSSAAGSASASAAGNASAPASGSTSGNGNEQTRRPHDEIIPARNFTKYVEYDFSKMTDTKGGFLSAEDDPHNRALHAGGPDADGEQKPAHMTLAEWERHRLLKKLRQARAGPFEPGISALRGDKGGKCRECGSAEIDWAWADTFGLSVCERCKEALPERYSLLTKSEARADYLLTDPELRDEALLPRLERPNPHKATWAGMQLFLRCQVEEYAFSDKRWGSAEALDAEFERREAAKKRRKDDKFKSKLDELKKRTRVDAYKRGRQGVGKEGGAQFGDRVSGGIGERHEHEWGRAVVNEKGETVKRCTECGMEVEELEF